VSRRLRKVPELLDQLPLANMMTPSSMMKVIHALMVMMTIQNSAELSIPKASSLLMLMPTKVMNLRTTPVNKTNQTQIKATVTRKVKAKRK
jgi:hypothetical protein